MKIFIFAHRLEVGGTQLNAIELATALRDLHGYDVVLFATPGPMVKLVEQKGLRYLPAPDARFHPSAARIRALCQALRRERPDLLHVWDWWQCIDAYYAAHLMMRIPMVVTDMMMHLTRFLPKWLPTTFGTPQVVEQAKRAGRTRVELLLPPVDVHHNAPGVVDPAPFRKQYGIESSDITVVTVSRIVEWLKGESLFQTVEAVRALGRRLPLRLLIAGDGTAREKLQRLADVVNGELGRRAVILVGELLDPRPAYAAADIVVGMGGSALRGMAFGKPAIIVGEQGFSAPFTPETADSFYNSGIYGRGADGRSNHRLIADLRGLAEQPDRLPELGHFSRQFVMRHFALEVVSARFAGFCRDAANSIPGIHVTAADACRTAALYVRERGFLIPSRPPACDLRP